MYAKLHGRVISVLFVCKTIENGVESLYRGSCNIIVENEHIPWNVDGFIEQRKDRFVQRIKEIVAKDCLDAFLRRQQRFVDEDSRIKFDLTIKDVHISRAVEMHSAGSILL